MPAVSILAVPRPTSWNGLRCQSRCSPCGEACAVRIVAFNYGASLPMCQSGRSTVPPSLGSLAWRPTRLQL